MMQSLRMKYILALLLATNHTLYSAYGYLDDSGIEVDADADGVEDVGINDSGKSESLKSYQCIYQCKRKSAFIHFELNCSLLSRLCGKGWF